MILVENVRQPDPDDKQPKHQDQREADRENIELRRRPGHHAKRDVDHQQRGDRRQYQQQRRTEHPAELAGQFPVVVDHQAAPHRQRGETLGEDLEHHQMTVHGQEQQRHQHGEELPDHRRRYAVGRVDHGGEAHAHLDGDDLPGHHKGLEEQLQGKTHHRTDENLLGNQQ
ncbi:hypothetical protein D3C73_1179720 [compost metagenome]